MYALAAFWTQILQTMFFSDPTQIGLGGIPVGLGGSIGGFIGAILMGKGKLFKAQYILFYGTALLLIGDIMYLKLNPDRFVLGCFAGFTAMSGAGMIMVGTVVTVQLTCIDSHIGLATLVLGSLRSIGGALAVTVYSSIMMNSVKEDAPKRLASEVPEIPEQSLGKFVGILLGGKPNLALKLPGITPEILKKASEVIKWSWAIAFQRIFIAALSFAVLAMLSTFFIKDVKSNMTNNVAVTLENDRSKKQREAEA